MSNTKFELRAKSSCIAWGNPMTQLTISQMTVLEIFLFDKNKWSFEIGVIFKCYMAFANFMSTFFNTLHWFLCFIGQNLIFFPWKNLPCLFPPYWQCLIHYWEWSCHLFLFAHRVRYNFPFLSAFWFSLGCHSDLAGSHITTFNIFWLIFFKLT